MTEGDLFNPGEGERRKRDGMDRAADNRAEMLELARSIARSVAATRGRVTADDVSRELQRRGYGRSPLGPAAGSIFKGPQWEWTGEFMKSKKITNHSRLLRVWKLKGQPC